MRLILPVARRQFRARALPAPMTPTAQTLDPRAERYFATADRYNRAATDLGYLSLEHAIRAGRMPEILSRAAGLDDGRGFLAQGGR